MKKYIRKNLCQKFCHYYKPLKQEDNVCMGFIVVEKLLKKGMKIPFNKSNNKRKPDKEKKLPKTMCFKCLFYENDCDFVQKKEGAYPCGGFMLLEYLLGTNVISIDDIQNII